MKSLILFALVIMASSARAQVGHPPDRSPYQDRDYNRDWTFFGGQFNGQPDPLGVTPRSGPIAGIRWQMHLQGPAYFNVRLAGGSIERTIIDPSKVLAERVIGTEHVPMLFGDAGLEISLTGHKTWHGLAPFVAGGVGVVGDVRGANDVGSYRFGIPFAMTAGTGVSWAPARHWSVRLEWTNYIYRVGYPATYYLKTTEDPAPLPVGAARSFWRRNPALLLGVTLMRPR